MSRFYRHDWSNSSSQTIYPFDAWRGSMSNGVLSGDVDSSSYRVPAGSKEWSYTVRGRGDFVLQRRRAPFSPRSNHVHEAYIHWEEDAPDDEWPIYQVQAVIGGYNGSHYLNDVHMATAPIDGEDEDLTWYQLDDAPFSPRSDVLVLQRRDPYNLYVIPAFYVIGGQTSHACGLYELGVCSREIWMLNVTVNATNGVPSVVWTNRTALPDAMASRCGSALLSTDTSTPGIYAVVAGQLSYNDSSCSTPPITVSERWRMDVHTLSVYRALDVAFSPRRWGGGSSDVRTVGGIRHVNISRKASGDARLCASELYADSNDGNGKAYDRGWTVPVPTIAGAGCFTTVVSYMSFGGVLPAAALDQWRNTRPSIDSDLIGVEWGEVAVNVTMVTAPKTYGGNLTIGRMQLPLVALLNEEELNDPNSSYALGANWASGYFDFSTLNTFGMSVTLHERPRAFADSVNDSSWWTPMAASSFATRRPLFNFDLRRRDHSAVNVFTKGLPLELWQWTSGGRSGSQYYNDVILTLPMWCLPPDDPSYLKALGPVQVVPWVWREGYYHSSLET